MGLTTALPSALSETLGKLRNVTLTHIPSPRASCMVSSWISDSSMFCQVSAGTGTGLSVLVYSGGQLGGMTNMFDYLLPQWDRTQPDHGPTTGAFSISIFGLFFGQVGAHFSILYQKPLPHPSLQPSLSRQFDTSPQIRFGDTSCEASKWISDTTIRCKMHQGLYRAAPHYACCIRMILCHRHASLVSVALSLFSS